jgi:hypothetical protein
MALEAC